jgi:hypothetical protein
MADDEEFEEPDAEFEEPEEEDIEPELDEDALVDVDDDVAFTVLEEDLAEVEVPEEEEEDEEAEPPRRVVPADDEDDDEDLVDPDDVEADLDTILKDRLVAPDEEPDDDEDEVEVDDRGDPVDRIQPKRPGEFVCQSCFLVKHPSQLADTVHQLCLDCV